jgi:hypothetical protein
MNGDIWSETEADARNKVLLENEGYHSGRENAYKILRGLKCKECREEIIYDYVENLYICLGCGL